MSDIKQYKGTVYSEGGRLLKLVYSVPELGTTYEIDLKESKPNLITKVPVQPVTLQVHDVGVVAHSHFNKKKS